MSYLGRMVGALGLMDVDDDIEGDAGTAGGDGRAIALGLAMVADSIRLTFNGAANPRPARRDASRRAINYKTDTVRAYLAKWYQVGPEARDQHITKTAFYDGYKKWCEEQGRKPLTKGEVSQAMLAIPVDQGRPTVSGRKQPRCWVGIKMFDYVMKGE